MYHQANAAGTMSDTNSNNANSSVSEGGPVTTQFYNYHEYHCPYNESLIITHHPNPYPHPYLDRETRVVRIPRLPTTDFPQFSNCLPGLEPAAITGRDECKTEDDRLVFVPSANTYMNQRFGNTSVSPLSNFIEELEFTTIVDKINSYLYDIYAGTNSNMFWLLLNSVFLDIPSIIILLAQKVLCMQLLQAKNTKLEAYVDSINCTFRAQGRTIRIVQPRESGYLSLDWVIPSQRDEQ